jgi:hypothetical protein
MGGTVIAIVDLDVAQRNLPVPSSQTPKRRELRNRAKRGDESEAMITRFDSLIRFSCSF